MGYLAYFGLPEFLITVSLEHFFFAFFTLLSLALFFGNCIELTRIIFHSKFHLSIMFLKWSIHCLALIMLLIFPAWAAFLFFYGKSGWEIIPASLSVLAILRLYIFPLKINSENDLYADLKLERAYEISSVISNASLSNIRLLEGRIFQFLLSVLIIISLSMVLGLVTAARKNTFLTMEQAGLKYALIRRYNDIWVFIEIKDHWKNLYEHEFVFEKKYILKKIESEQSLEAVTIDK